MEKDPSHRRWPLWKSNGTNPHGRCAGQRCSSKQDALREVMKTQMCPTQTVHCYPAVRRNEPSSPEKMWKNLKCRSLSRRRQPAQATRCATPTTRRLEKVALGRRDGKGCGEQDKAAEPRGSLGQKNYSMQYSGGGYVSLRVGGNPRGERRPERTLTYTVGLE